MIRSNVNQVLKDRHTSRSQLARELGTTYHSVYRWTKDCWIRKLSLEKLEMIAEALGCKINDLYEEEK